MPIATRHPEYDEINEKYELTEDAFEGCVKEYVPQLTSETKTAYEARINRAAYYNVTERTLLALLGALMRKPYTITGVVGDEPITDLNSFAEFVQSAYKEILLGGRVGLFVDYDDALGSPKIVSYCSENIINWCDKFVVIEEDFMGHDEKDPYKLVSYKQWRELCYDENGFYQVRIWKQTAKDQYEVVEVITPTVRGKRLDTIPFFFVTPYDNTEELFNPPLYNLATLNVQHFKVSTDYSHGLHFLALPTPWIAGDLYTADGSVPKQLTIGTDSFIHLIQDSKVGYLEFGGAGLGAIANQLEKLEEMMFSMGSRMLMSKKGVESAEALQLRAGSESAILETLTNSLENGLTKALAIYNAWAGSSTVPEVKLNKDFSAAVMDPVQLKALLEAYTTGVISLDTLLLKFFEGELVPDPVAEKIALESKPVVAPAQPTVAP